MILCLIDTTSHRHVRTRISHPQARRPGPPDPPCAGGRTRRRPPPQRALFGGGHRPPGPRRRPRDGVPPQAPPPGPRRRLPRPPGGRQPALPGQPPRTPPSPGMRLLRQRAGPGRVRRGRPGPGAGGLHRIRDRGSLAGVLRSLRHLSQPRSGGRQAVNAAPAVTRATAFVAAFALAALLAACGSAGGREATPSPRPSAAELRVGVTLPVFADFVREIAKDHADVFSILPPGADPHTYEPTPSDIESIASADVIIVNNTKPGVEGSILDVIEANKPSYARTLPLMDNVPSPRAAELGNPETTAAEAGDNPHLWLDPGLAYEYDGPSSGGPGGPACHSPPPTPRRRSKRPPRTVASLSPSSPPSPTWPAATGWRSWASS